MKRKFSWLLLSTSMGCSVPEFGLNILGVSEVTGDVTFINGNVESASCMVDSAVGEALAPILLDTTFGFRLRVPYTVQNTLTEAHTVVIGQGGTAFEQSPRNQSRPVRFDVRWECDSNGFATDLPALVIPAFNPELPFCLDRRAENEDFVGFDVVPASGPLIQGDELTVVTVELIPDQFGRAVDEMFEIAVLADRCCQVINTNCSGNDLSQQSCSRLNDIFNALDPTALQVSSGDPAVASPDLLQFRPFALLDGTYALNADFDRFRDATTGARYNMRARGVMEAVTLDGDTIESNEITTEIAICRSCGIVRIDPVTGAPVMPLERTSYPAIVEDVPCFYLF